MDINLSQSSTRPRRLALGGLVADRWLLGVAIVGLLLLTALPYLYGSWRAQQSGTHFVGVLINIPDNMQYWSWLRDHRSALVIPNRLTSEPNDPALFNVLWLVLGQIERLTGLEEPQVYQILRVVGSAAFLVSLWWFVGLLMPKRIERWAAWALATLGGGLGWIWVVEKYLSGLADVRFPFHLYVSESNTFFNILAFPHFLMAAAFILAVLGFYWLGERGRGWGYYALATVAAVLLGVQHAYDLIMVYAILGIYTLLRFAQARRILWGPFWGLAAVGFISFPPAGYFLYITTQNPLWIEVLDQFSNAGVFTPSPLGLLVLLGFPFMATIVYGALLLRSGAWRHAFTPAGDAGDQVDLFLWTWAVVGFGLLYIPADFQIHMLNPYQVPLALLTIQALVKLADHLRAAARGKEQGAPSLIGRLSSFPALAGLMLLATLPVNLYLITWQMSEMHKLERPFFISADEYAGLNWLEARDSERAVVFSGLDYGQYVPAMTSHRAVLAHWAMTAHFYDRRDDVARYFDAATSPAERAAMLERLGVRYVVYGREERALGGFNPASDPTLELAFDRAEIQVFAVR